MDSLNLSTNLSDYAPASTAVVTATGLAAGSTLEFQVLHVMDPGPDGIYGTLDDSIDWITSEAGDGHDAWYVTDGVRTAGADGILGNADDGGDLDGVADGVVVTGWYVNPDDSLGETFLLAAAGIEVGADGAAGTADDVATTEVATSSFTDAGGAYSISFAAAHPEDYIPPIPFPFSVTPIIGRGDGDAEIDSAWYMSPVTLKDVHVHSLAPEDMALGQVVPFEIQITVRGSTAPEDGVITFTAYWAINTTSGDDFGYDEAYGVWAAFVDTGDGAHVDPEGDATVQSYGWTIVGDQIQGTFTVSGLDNGDVVVVEPWLVLEDAIPEKASGNVQSGLISAQTASGDTINTGAETTPLLRVQQFFNAQADLSVIKTDSAGGDPLTAGPDTDPYELQSGQYFTYTILAANHSIDTVANGVVVSDALDPDVTFVSATGGGTWADDDAIAGGGVVTWNLGALAPGQTAALTVTVRVNDGADYSDPSADLLNSVSITSITDDPNLVNNTNTEPTNLVRPGFDDLAPEVTIVKDGEAVIKEGGDTATYTFLITNNSAETDPITVTSLTDDRFGDLLAEAEAANGGNPIVLDPGESFSFSVDRELMLDAGDSHTNIVTVVVTDDDDDQATDDDDHTVTAENVMPTLLVTKTPGVTAVPETGADVTFTFTVKNTSGEAVTITSLADSVFGPLAGDADCQVGTVLAAGEERSFEATYWIEGDYSGPAHVDVFTAQAVDNDGSSANDDDDATVDFTDVLPTVLVTKTPSVAEVPETGGNVTFTFTVKNTSSEEPVTITSLADSVFGPLAGDADCQVGTVLAAGEERSFEATYWIEGDYSGPAHNDVFTAVAEDNDGTDATDDDDATVGFTDVMPYIEVTKTADPVAVPETGGDVTFTFVVQNTSSEEAVTITSVMDTVWGNLSGESGLVGTTLAAGATTSFQITRWVEGDYSGPDHVNVVTVQAVDNDGSTASDSDDATVDFTNVLPYIEVTKTPSVASVPETGGDVTFEFVITNTSSEEAVTITSVVDSVYGDLSAESGLVGTSLAAGAWASFQITRWVEGDFSGPAHVDVFTATAVDNDGSSATDDDDATVDFTDVAAVITVDKVVDANDADAEFHDVEVAVGATPHAMGDPIAVGDITYQFTISASSLNAAGDPVTITSVVDDQLGDLTAAALAANGGAPIVLDPGESFTFTYAVQDAQFAEFADPLVNTVTVTGEDNDGTPTSDTDQATVKVAALELQKVFDGVTGGNDNGIADQAGEVLNYTLRVINIGNEPLTGITVTDSRDDSVTYDSGDVNGNDVLDDGETWLYKASYTLTQADLDYDPLDALAGALPAQVTMKVEYPAAGDDSYYDVTIANGGELNGVYDNWCVDTDHTIANNTWYTANVYSSYETLPAGLVEHPENLDLVNWILNQNYVYAAAFDTAYGGDAGGNGYGESLGNFTYGDVQRAIWSLIEDQQSTNGLGAWNQNRVNEIVAAAQANGEGFVPGCGDTVGVLLQPVSGTVQVTIGQVTLTELGVPCGCIFNLGTADSNESGPESDAVCTDAYQAPEISIVKLTNGADGDTFLVGSDITWTYEVTNTGNVTLHDVEVTDDQGVIPVYVSGDDGDGRLEVGETWLYEATGMATAGLYENVGEVTAAYNEHGGERTASDPSSYFGADPQISIVKVTADGATSGDDLDILSGEAIKWRYTVTNAGNVALADVVVTDDQGVTPVYVSGDTDGDSELDLTETWLYEAAGFAGVGAYGNTGTASGSFTDDAGASRTDTASDGSGYFGLDPRIDIEKLVSVDGGLTWVDADSPTGPTLVNTSGYDPMFKLVVTNTGNVDLTGVTVTDDKGTADTVDDLTVAVGNLAAGGTWETGYSLDWQLGQHTNTAAVSADPYADDAGHTRGVSDADDANYYGVMPGLVTNSSLCTFGDWFNLIFTPDYKLGGGNFKLSDSNPGQFYYNVFYQGTGASTVDDGDPTNGDETADDFTDFTFEIPYPFVTQGAVPVHVYSGVAIDQYDGQICLTPLGEIANYKLEDLSGWQDGDDPGDEPDGWNDLNGDGVLNIGDTISYTISDVPTMGFVYLNMHMDFDLEKVTGWVKSGENALDNTNVTSDADGLKILEGTEFEFSAGVDGVDLVGSEDSIYNDNIFKNIKGLGGMVQADDSGTAGLDEIALAGQHMIVTNATGTTRMGDAYTDADGWYYTQFMATGKQAAYRVYWDQDDDGQYLDEPEYATVQMGGAAGKWAQVDLTVVDPVDVVDPVGEVDSYNDLVWT